MLQNNEYDADDDDKNGDDHDVAVVEKVDTAF